MFRKFFNLNLLVISMPSLFTIFFILHLFSVNYYQLSISNIIIPINLGVFFSLVLFVIFYILVRDNYKSAVMSSITVIFFFLFGPLFDSVESLVVNGMIIGRIRFFLLVWTAGVFFVLLMIYKTKHNIKYITRSFIIMSCTLFIFQFGNVVFFSQYSQAGRELHANFGNTEGAKPDIYYIILDGYANSNTLKDLMEFDNSDFIEKLSNLDFVVNQESRSNYARTFLSLPSSLNMDYFPTDILDTYNQESYYINLYRQIRDNKVLNYLKDSGYTTYHISSGWDQTQYNQYADINISCGRFDEFLGMLIHQTPLRILDKKYHITENDKKSRIVCTYESIRKIADDNRPTFVFAHVVLPHAPYVFDKDGNTPQYSNTGFGDNIDNKDLYLGQLEYTNHWVFDLASSLLSGVSHKNDIIIFQSDHGSATTVNDAESWESGVTNDIFLKERMRNFIAVHAPQISKEKILVFSETPVNLFRGIFDEYFGGNFGYLNNKSFYSTPGAPFFFYDVTDNVLFR